MHRRSPSQSVVSARRGLAALALLVLCGLPGREVAAKRAKKPPLSDANIEALFEAKGEAIRDCALQNAIYKGATALELTAKLLVGRDGRVFGATVSAKGNGGDSAAVEKCVSAVLSSMSFPTGGSTFREILRNWRFATK